MKNLWLFKKYFFIYKNRLVLLILLVMSGALLEGIGLSLFYPLVEYVQKGDAFLADAKFKLLFGGMKAFGISPGVFNFILIIFFVIVFRFVVMSVTQVISAWTYNPIKRQIRDDSFGKIINSPMGYFQSVSSGKIVNILMNEVNCIGYAVALLVQLVTNVAFLLVYTFGALFLSWRLTVMVILIALVRYVALKPFIIKSRELGQARTRVMARINSYLVNIYQGIDLIKSYGTEERELDKFKKESVVFCDNENSLVYNKAASGLLEGVLGTALICFVIYFAITKLDINGTPVLVFLFIMSRLAPVVATINENRVRIAEFTSGIVYLKQVVDEKSWPVQEWGDKEKTGFTGKIVFEKVSFSYYENAGFALEDITFEIKKNEQVAIVGESGAGKTTFIRLILRLYNATKGRILIDETDIADLNRESLKRLISVISQDTFIFDDTVENNIKYGVNTCDKKEFWNAARWARADKFIDELPEKEKTMLGERGVKLSGGQRQRIAIARAFLRNSPILILDEATSELDSNTESLIQDALDELAKNRTMIIIAHRFSTIKNANRIVVFDKGKIAEIGTHEQLIEGGNLYRNYHNLQVY